MFIAVGRDTLTHDVHAIVNRPRDSQNFEITL